MCAGAIRFIGCLVPLFILLSPGVAGAQATARVKVAQENFRKDPRGRRLATVLSGAELAVVGARGDWVEVELRGWIWAPSVVETDRGGFDLAVSAPGGENLRVRPQGRIAARLLEGCLLDRLGGNGDWIHVQRRGWIWKASLEIGGAPPPPAAEAEAAAESEPGGRGRAASTGAAGEAPPFVTARAPLVVHATPDGDTMAIFRPGARAEVLGRTGDWIRVRVDGWVYGPAALDSAPDLADTGDLSPAQLRADPARYKGALVRWRVQFVSLRRAERARSDFQEGEPFLLARGPAGDAGFVYLAVPERLLPLAESLQPLDYVTVVGRVRTGRSPLTGSPVVDLTEIEKLARER